MSAALVHFFKEGEMTAWFKAGWLLLGSGVVVNSSRNQAGDEHAE